MCIDVYIYIYIERERNIKVGLKKNIRRTNNKYYTYINIYTHTYIHIHEAHVKECLVMAWPMCSTVDASM